MSERKSAGQAQQVFGPRCEKGARSDPAVDGHRSRLSCFSSWLLVRVLLSLPSLKQESIRARQAQPSPAGTQPQCCLQRPLPQSSALASLILAYQSSTDSCLTNVREARFSPQPPQAVLPVVLRRVCDLWRAAATSLHGAVATRGLSWLPLAPAHHPLSNDLLMLSTDLLKWKSH